jgi:hypothetical protein
MSSLFGRRAVVVGGGIGGLSVAGALAGYFEQVDVLERDRLTASVESRSGTAQDRHPHGLLAGGLKALGEIFPGFERDLAGAGAVPVGLAQDARFEVLMLASCRGGISAYQSSVRPGRSSSSCCDVGLWRSLTSRCGRAG